MSREAAGVGVLMLAAGAGRRFGADKREARLPDGRGLLEASLAAVPSSLDQRLLVLRPGDDALANHWRGAGWQVLIAPEAALGMGHSLAAGITAAQTWPGALIALADMPWLKPETYLRLAEALVSHDIVVPVHHGQRGHPVGFRQPLFAELATLEGDQGARAVLARHAQRCREVEVEDPGILRDVDTPSALRER